jgi:hypothetical protein
LSGNSEADRIVALGRYFDNPADEDDLQLQDWQVIDMTAWG